MQMWGITLRNTSFGSLRRNNIWKPSDNHCKINLFWTFLSEPDGAPQNVIGQNSSSTSILVTWDEVPADKQNGIITGYTITYQSQTENDNESVLVGANNRRKNLTGLKEYVNYNITVFASTVKGNGPANDPVIVVRTDQDSKYLIFESFSCGCYGGFCVCLVLVC